MHLHTLTIQALGPFAGRHTIDLASLGAGGLFLLEGPTGAGKSTLIDAVVFALYGKVASREASEERLRSAHAAPTDETFVDLVLETGAGVFRVRRTPAYQRPKQRGTGTTTQQATVRLWRLADPTRPDDGELLTNRLDEAGLEIQRIVGLDRTQFVQTVVLPQGEFAAFLRANPEDRRGLLQKVFGTEVYERLQQRLERMRAEAGRGVDTAREAVVRAADHFVGAAALAGERAEQVRAAAQQPDADGGLVPLVRAVAAELEGHATTAADVASRAREACASAREALDAGRAVVAADRRRTALRAELAALEGRAAEHAADVARLERARRAAAVLPTLAGAERATKALVLAEQALTSTRAAVAEDVRDLVDPSEEPELGRKRLLAERDACTGLRATLRRAVDVEDGLPALRARVASAERTAAERATALAGLEEQRAALPGRRAELAAALAQVAGASATLTAAQDRLARVTARWAAVQQVTALEAEVAAAEAAVTEAARAAGAAVDHAAALQRARVAGMAGELAAALRPGEPCVVCGGTEHPAPAALAPDHVAEDDVAAAEAERARATEVLATARGALEGLRERLEARRREAGGTADEVAAERTAAQDAVDEAEAAVARHAELTARLAELDGEAERLEAALADARAARERAELDVTARREELVLAEAAVAEGRGDAGSVRERLESVEARLADVTALADTLATVEEARERADARADELVECMADHGFEEVADVRDAALADDALAALERDVAAYRTAEARVRAGLAEPEVAALPEVVDVDLDALVAAHARAEAAAEDAAGGEARARHLADASVAARDQVEAAVAALGAAEAQAGPVVRMAELAAAGGTANGRQLTLATYVLLRRFEDVVAAANARLMTISDGRYELVRSDTKEAVRARKAGLAMKVVDHRTETERDPRTLSGGETFYVSLCLALGLADVVTAEAGGIELGTLFVDEGFGSLDDGTLDVVLAELGRLREGGRVVGVVSHVEALKQSIAERIEVRPRPDGSSTLTVRA